MHLTNNPRRFYVWLVDEGELIEDPIGTLCAPELKKPVRRLLPAKRLFTPSPPVRQQRVTIGRFTGDPFNAFLHRRDYHESSAQG